MHTVIYILVEATSVDDAVARAVRAFNENLKTNSHTTYDYCWPMDADRQRVGANRWSQFADGPLAARLNTVTGGEWVCDAMEQTRHAFVTNVLSLLAYVDVAAGLDDLLDAYGRVEGAENPHAEARVRAEELYDQYESVFSALYDDLMVRHAAREVSGRELTEVSLFDDRRYDDSLHPVDSSFDEELVHETTDEVGPQNSWVVPLDAHF